jgi:hypothetical protein
VVSLSSTAPAKLTVPATVTILAGQLTTGFTATVLDDSIVDGNKTIAVIATATSQTTGSGSITILDNDFGTLVVAVPATAAEGVGTVQGSVTMTPAPSGTVTISLSSSDPTAATVPASVTFLAGQSVALFTLNVVDDTKIDGTQSTTITASASGWTPATATMTVSDNENTKLTFFVPTIMEGIPETGTITISGALPNPLVVSLLSANTARLVVPATVTIPAGSTTANFTATAVDDTLVNGSVFVLITASAPGFTNGTYNLFVHDNELDHFSVSVSPNSPQLANKSFSGSAGCYAVDGYTVPFTGTVTVSASAGGLPVPVTPTVATFTGSSLWLGSFTIGAPATGVTIKFDDGQGHTGTSSPFNVVVGALDHFGISTISSPQNLLTPFGVTLTAQDTANNTVTGFAGSASLNCGPPATTTGTGTLTLFVPMAGTARTCRSQVIYTAAEVGPGARKLIGLAMNLSQIPTTLNSWTIRMKHTPLASYSTASWESAGWTVVHQSNLVLSPLGWVTFQFATPFDYDGVSNLMVDFSFNNTVTGSDGYCSGSSTTTNRTVYVYTNTAYGDPLTWSGTSAPTPNSTANVPNIRLFSAGTVPLTLRSPGPLPTAPGAVNSPLARWGAA